MSRIEPYTGDRRALLPLFALADDSARQVAGYLQAGEVLVAREGDEVVGHAQLVETVEPTTLELKSLAVAKAWQGRGTGAALVAAAVERSRGRCARRLLVATATADTKALRFYQRQGFRMLRIVRDVFVAQAGYAEGTLADGIPLRDQAWLDLQLHAACPEDVAIRSAHDMTPDQIEAIEDRLYDVNSARSGHHDARPLGFVAEVAGAQVGAVAGYSWGCICDLRQMWVAEPHRGQGLGRSLLLAAIGEARARGCSSVMLATYDFQAPGFYRKLGFEVVATVADKPLRHDEIIMRLPLR